MQPLEPKLEIASRLLSGIISQDRNRKLTDRSDDIRHSLDVAAELIRQSDDAARRTLISHWTHRFRLKRVTS